MADWKPIKIENGEFARFAAGDTVPVEHGGTGVTSLTALTQAMNLDIGTDVQAWNTRLDNLSSLSGNGMLVKSGDAFLIRDVVGTANNITVTNGSGVSGNPTINLATVTNSNTGSFLKVTVDTFGRTTGSTAVTTGDITALVNSQYLQLAGGTLTGPLTLSGTPTNNNHAATKEYVDERAVGNNQKVAVRAGTTGNITLSGTQTIDGVSLVVGNRVLVKDQTDAKQNGIYIISASAWTRSTDADTGVELIGATVLVSEGDTNSGMGFSVISPTPITIGTSNILWTQSSGGAQIVAGNGLTKTGNTLAVAVINAGRLTTTASGIDLAISGVSAGSYSKVTVDTYGRVTVGSNITLSELGGQPLNTLLTSLTTVSGNGILVKASATTAVGRTITGTANNIAVVNGDGVSGNPTINLIPTGISAGTYNSLTVDVMGRVTAGTSTPLSGVVVQLQNSTATAVNIGRAVYTNGDGTFGLANANSTGTKNVSGIVFDTAINASASGSIAVAGIVTATIAQWNAVTGQSSGLTVGSIYFLSASTAGGLTTTAPTTGYIAPVGIALSTTKLSVNIGQTILL